MLTPSQKLSIERAAKLSGEVSLYQETSLTGKSETLRYKRSWLERTHWGISQRTRSGMILSVTIHVMPDGSDRPDDLNRYASLCDEAKNYFAECRSVEKVTA